jgi:hypothetical protein
MCFDLKNIAGQLARNFQFAAVVIEDAQARHTGKTANLLKKYLLLRRAKQNLTVRHRAEQERLFSVVWCDIPGAEPTGSGPTPGWQRERLRCAWSEY